MVYEASSDLVVGIVGEAFSGKFYTLFGAPLSERTSDMVDMRGVLERITDDLLQTAEGMDGKEVRTKVFVRYGYLSKTKLGLENTYKKVSHGQNLLEDIM